MTACTLGELCVARIGIQTGPFGSQLHKEDYAVVGTPIVTVEHLGDNRITRQNLPLVSDQDVARLARYRLEQGDIVFSRVGSVDRRALVRGKESGWLFSGRCLRVRPNRELVDPEFLSYYLGLPAFKDYIRGVAVGATMPSINTKILSDAPVTLPGGVSVQRLIGRLLGMLDDKIELNRQMNETLEAMAQAIFRDWFVDFGPVRRKLEGATDPVAIMGGLMPGPARAAELAGLFPETIGDDGLPTGWRSDPLKEHIANFDSKRVPVSSGERAKRPGPFPYYGAASAMGTIDNFLFDGVFVLVGEDGSVVRSGGLAVTQYVWGQFWVNNHAHVLQGAGAVSTEQLLLYFNEEPVEPYVTGAVQMKLSQGRMGMMPFIFPGDPICGEFGRVVGPLFERLRAAAAENRTLAETRDYLLPRLMSGEVRVGELEAEVA